MSEPVEKPYKFPPISLSDIGLLLFLIVFLIIGGSTIGLIISSGQISFALILAASMFIVLPIVFIIFLFKRFVTWPKFAKHGTAIEAKIIGYQNDAIQVNHRPVKDLVVRYWDEETQRVEQAIIDTNLTGTQSYRTGRTVWIYRLGDEYAIASRSYDKTLPHEAEIMGYGVQNACDSASGYIPNANMGPTFRSETLHGITCPCCGQQVMIDERWRVVDANGNVINMSVNGD